MRLCSYRSCAQIQVWQCYWQVTEKCLLTDALRPRLARSDRDWADHVYKLIMGTSISALSHAPLPTQPPLSCCAEQDIAASSHRMVCNRFVSGCFVVTHALSLGIVCSLLPFGYGSCGAVEAPVCFHHDVLTPNLPRLYSFAFQDTDLTLPSILQI